ncbi:hypothetical protein FA95DRAFT_305882 [Auriscalpium vulgare]|uniref:Uncharacterized protein n=1 Tax=Auriscalpium vulgare TaxID=40419 RepID=A0ACB8RJH0_9AGAM|nr:hypothetical protein FA95DRAFT_305882 [Auriscalpium vulgare]
MCKILPDRTLTVLDIAQIPHREWWEVETWEYVLEDVQGIQDLRVNGKVADQLCEALGWWRPSGGFGSLRPLAGGREYFLPDLADLVLGDVTLPECLPELLQARAEAGCPLRSLRVTLCDGEVDGWQELLRRVVDDLEISQYDYQKEESIL